MYPSGYDKSLIAFYDCYVQLAKYVNPKTITIDDKMDKGNAVAIVYQ